MSSWLGYLEALALCPLYVLAFVLSFLLGGSISLILKQTTTSLVV